MTFDLARGALVVAACAAPALADTTDYVARIRIVPDQEVAIAGQDDVLVRVYVDWQWPGGEFLGGVLGSIGLGAADQASFAELPDETSGGIPEFWPDTWTVGRRPGPFPGGAGFRFPGGEPHIVPGNRLWFDAYQGVSNSREFDPSIEILRFVVGSSTETIVPLDLDVDGLTIFTFPYPSNVSLGRGDFGLDDIIVDSTPIRFVIPAPASGLALLGTLAAMPGARRRRG